MDIDPRVAGERALMAHGPIARGRGRSFVYALRSFPSGNIVYVGQTTNPSQRWYELYKEYKQFADTYPQVLESVRHHTDLGLRKRALKAEQRWILRLEKRGIKLVNFHSFSAKRHIPRRFRASALLSLRKNGK